MERSSLDYEFYFDVTNVERNVKVKFKIHICGYYSGSSVNMNLPKDKTVVFRYQSQLQTIN